MSYLSVETKCWFMSTTLKWKNCMSRRHATATSLSEADSSECYSLPPVAENCFACTYIMPQLFTLTASVASLAFSLSDLESGMGAWGGVYFCCYCRQQARKYKHALQRFRGAKCSSAHALEWSSTEEDVEQDYGRFSNWLHFTENVERNWDKTGFQ